MELRDRDRAMTARRGWGLTDISCHGIEGSELRDLILRDRRYDISSNDSLSGWGLADIGSYGMELRYRN